MVKFAKWTLVTVLTLVLIAAGRLILPLKVWRDRVRPANGTYVPDAGIDPQSANWERIREAIVSTRSVD